MAVEWSYYSKFERVDQQYLPTRGQGDTMATQICTAVNKLVYKWYNDGDVYDNQMSYMDGWCNDLSSYANWLYKYVPRTKNLLLSIEGMYEQDYEELLKELADMLLDGEDLESMSRIDAVGSIYDCDGPFKFVELSDDEDEDLYW